MKNKRGQFFTVLAVLIIFLMFASFEIYTYLHQRESIKTRVATMNSFLDSTETNLERQLYISGFRILFLANSEIASTGSYIDVDDLFNEAFFNGTVNGVAKNITVGATYNDLLSSLNSKATKINVVINMSNTSILVDQIDPWNVRLMMISNFNMNDKENLARWSKTQNISALIPISGFEDPIFTVNSFSKVSRKANRTVYSSLANISDLSDHFNKGYYFANSDAPSFLNRLEGNLSSDPNGIESFVNLYELKAQGIFVDETVSVIDHTYFGVRVSGSSVSGMPALFKIDNTHRSFYNISG